MSKNEKQSGNAVLKFSEHKRKRGDELEADIDALFTLPLTEFTGERNALAARLKKSGRGDEATLVKALAKPPVSAWAVNQLYWNHRETFDQLLASGERFHKFQASGKAAEMREALNARRAALTELSDLATSLLRDAGHNPSLDIIRRITSTLEAMSAMSASGSRSDGPQPGRLIHDVDPPGFEALATWVTSAGMTQTKKEPAQAAPSKESSVALSKPGGKVGKGDDARQLEEKRKARIAAAKAALQDAKRSLTKAESRKQKLEEAQEKADADAKKTEKLKRAAEDALRKAKIASEDADRRARGVAEELDEAAGAVEDAERQLKKVSKELEVLVRV